MSKIALHADGVFKGYKTDTFWSLNKERFKQHDEIKEHLVKNLLSGLNGTSGPEFKDARFDDNVKIELFLEDENSEVKEKVTLFKNDEGVWKVGLNQYVTDLLSTYKKILAVESRDTLNYDIVSDSGYVFLTVNKVEKTVTVKGDIDLSLNKKIQKILEMLELK